MTWELLLDPEQERHLFRSLYRDVEPPAHLTHHPLANRLLSCGIYPKSIWHSISRGSPMIWLAARMTSRTEHTTTTRQALEDRKRETLRWGPGNLCLYGLRPGLAGANQRPNHPASR